MKKALIPVQEVGQVKQGSQADNDNQVLTMWLHGRPVVCQNFWKNYYIRRIG
jgi:hypothetical protein